MDIFRKHNVIYLSSNGAFYDDISDRVMTEIGMLVPHISVNSCDEAFANLYGIPDIPGKGREIRNKVMQNTGIPVSLGIAKTKTLCKVANRFCKNFPKYNGVCIIDTEEKRLKALKLTNVSDIWGIGKSYTKILNSQGVKTALEFTLKPRSFVRKHLSVVGERIWEELHGVPCIITDMPEVKDQILNSRTFGKKIREYNELLSAIAYFADLGMKKARQQKSMAKGIGLFISTNRFSTTQPHYYASKYIKLPYATLDTGEIMGYCRTLLQEIYRPGLEYNQAGVLYSDLIQQDAYQYHLLDTKDRTKQYNLAKAIDALEARFGFGTVNMAIQDAGKNNSWRPQANFLSAGSTRSLKNAIKVKVGFKSSVASKVKFMHQNV